MGVHHDAAFVGRLLELLAVIDEWVVYAVTRVSLGGARPIATLSCNLSLALASGWSCRQLALS